MIRMAQPDEQAGSVDPLFLLEWIDGVADGFEAAWERGTPPRISDYLGNSSGERRTALVRELARIDQERRRKAGENVSWDEYVRRFPELLEPEPDVLRLPLVATEHGPPAAAAPPGAENRPAVAGYEILGDLGHGGMGTVYKARQRSLKRLVALKVIRCAAAADPRSRARFHTEAEAAARLQHPNIVQIYEVGEQDGVPYLALEYVDGGTLEQRLAGEPQPARQAAELVETLARAMDYAHQRGVVHRDLKPANVLLRHKSEIRSPKSETNSNPETQAKTETPNPTPGSGGPGLGLGMGDSGLIVSTFEFRISNFEPKIADFGLAKLAEAEVAHTLSGAIVGTPSYMAPEQADGRSDTGPAIDVYALGAVLYECLTGRPPFRGASLLDTLEQVRTEEAIPPRRLVPKLPRDLETICLKAMAREPARRYATAGALADDLRRFRNREPILARRVGPAGRLGRWCRRHPARAGLAFACAALVVTVFVAAVLVALSKTAAERSRRREGLVQQLQGVRPTGHAAGWSDDADRLLDAAARLRPDDDLRGLAAAAGAGLDARAVRHLEQRSASWVAFDAAGARLLLGGRNDGWGRPVEGATLWEPAADRLRVARRAGPGPVAFRRDGTPLYLVPGAGPALFLRDLFVAKTVSECRFRTSPPGPLELVRGELEFPVLALSSDGALAAATAARADGTGATAAWDAGAGRLLFQADRPAGALALAPAGNLLAGSTPRGGITLWSVPDGAEAANLQAGRATIHSLAFSADGGRLAAGDSAGTVTVWDVATRLPVTYCYGSHHDVYAVAFSPDGTLLASGGRGPARLWDAATGRLLLSLPSGGLVTAVVFAPDAGRLVVGGKAPSRVTVWELDAGRGTQTMRGLTSQASHVCLSDDGRLLAALAHNWQIGIWDVRSGALRRVLDAPRGGAEDDAALAFDAAGERLACTAGAEARLWDVAGGRELAAWPLPAGAKDQLAFRPSGELLSARAETNGHGAVPVCRVRNLLGPRPELPAAEIAGFDRHLLDILLAPDGGTLVVEGIAQAPGGPRRTIKAYDTLTGTERWALPSTNAAPAAALALDPTGRLLAVRTDNRADAGSLADVASGTVLGPVAPFPLALAPGAAYRVSAGWPGAAEAAQGYALARRGDAGPRLLLGLETTPSFRPAFSRDGTLLAWSNADGTVSVCRLGWLQQRLARLGLDW
jgi:serine/threonine protein kinase/WD40 repeat protein